MTKLRTIVAVGAVLMIGIAPSLAQPGKCTGSYEQYRDYVAALTKVSAQSRTAADANPIYEADVGYYSIELAAAKQCVAQLQPVATALR